MSFEKDQAWQKLQEASAEFSAILEEEDSTSESVFIIATRVLPELDMPDELKEHLKMHQDLHPDAEMQAPMMSLIAIGGRGESLVDSISTAMEEKSADGPGSRIRRILMAASAKSAITQVFDGLKKARNEQIGEDILSQVIKTEDEEFNPEGEE
jgi:hypothetical protein